MNSSAAKAVVRPLASAYAGRWPAGSRLFLVGEGVGWVIDRELRQLAMIARELDVRLAPRRLFAASRDQAVFYGSHFSLLREPWAPPPHRLATAYFHGRPGTPGYPEFDEAYRCLRQHHDRISRVQVTHREMEEVVLSSGIDPAKVFRIPIGVDLDVFRTRTRNDRRSARLELGLPESAFVVGSFQKDGVGFGDGLEPKTIKGPDVLVAALAAARATIPELYALLSGPARGYVRSELDRLGVPYRHRATLPYEKVGLLYAAIDAYVVASRQEGGPKGVLEAMASGVPVVSTRVGQASEIVKDGKNGWLVDVEDGEAIADRLVAIASGGDDLDTLRDVARVTAAANAYSEQPPLWRAFFDGFVGS